MFDRSLLENLPISEITLRWEYLVYIAVFFLVAYIIYRLRWRFAQRIVNLTPHQRQLRPERLATLQGVIAGLITALAFVLASLFSLSLFIDSTTLVWVVGLFSAAFGLGARPLVSDFLHGLSFLFEDPFGVGEKVQLPDLASGKVEGTIERVNLRTTQIRATTGELFTVPNGEIRLVRNYSRGRFSMANIKLKVAAGDLTRTLELLQELAPDALIRLPNLLEPWQVVSESGELGERTELTLLAKARYGAAAELRPRLLTLVQEELAIAGIEIAG